MPSQKPKTRSNTREDKRYRLKQKKLFLFEPKYSESISVVEFYLKSNNFSQNWKLFRCSNIVILIHNILMHTHWWWKPTWEFRTRRTQLLSKISSLSCGTLVIEVIREYFIFNGWKSLLTPHSLTRLVVVDVLLSFRFIWIHKRRRYYMYISLEF